MVSVIIPAHNEEMTIGGVVASVIHHPEISEVIVVDDGSIDDTSVKAKQAGANVIRLSENRGKGNAMNEGVLISKDDIILFLDADVVGMDHNNISKIINPVISGKYSMFVGLRSRKILFLNHLMRYFPIIGGDRALVKNLWKSIPAKYLSDFKVEIALNYFSKRTPLGMGFTLIDGVTHRIKEEKYGIVSGFLRRLSMILDIFIVSLSLYVYRFFWHADK